MEKERYPILLSFINIQKQLIFCCFFFYMEIAYKYLMLSFTKLPISMLSKKSIPASPVLSLHT